ncbi:hypothetical protein EU537_10050 [Candidatus Thorarchaeota archaeon]|nr:MAG: hypothetical protein EU537_10050 [Candidatus Thorarchaeota archaeon]
MQELDITPLLATRELGLNVIGSPVHTVFSKAAVEQANPHLATKVNHFDSIRNRYTVATVRSLLPLIVKYEDSKWKIRHLAFGLTKDIDIQGMGLIDIPLDKFQSHLQETASSDLSEFLVSFYCDQIDRGGTTIGADIQGLSEHDGECAIRAKAIINLRNEEMKQVYVLKNSHTIDLRPLWLTAYGFQILSGLKLGLECSKEEFEQVQEAIEKLGFEIEVREDGLTDYPDTISPELWEYIWRLAEDPELREKMKL